MRARVVLRLTAVALAAVAGLNGIAPGAAADVNPTEAGATVSSGAGPATVSPEVRAAVGRGPTDVIVVVDATAVVATLDETDAATTPAKRAAGAVAANVAYVKLKSEVISASPGGVSSVRDFDQLPVQVLRVTSEAALDALALAPGVTSVTLPGVKTVDATPSNLSLIHEPEAVRSGFAGAGVRVAVLDSGVDYTLPGVGAAFGNCSKGPGSAGCRIARYVDSASPSPRDVSVDHHGTNVSGIVAATAPQATLSVYNVFPSGKASDVAIFAALNDVIKGAAKDNVRAVNMSFGYDSRSNGTCVDDQSRPYSATFVVMRALGIVPVVAAGNNAHDDATKAYVPGVASPACATGALAVGAVYSADSADTNFVDCVDRRLHADSLACFSQGGKRISLLAPGGAVTAAGVTQTGTSQAAPHVAGAVADLVSAKPSATAMQLARALTGSGPLVLDARDGRSVHRLDVTAAIAALQRPGAEVSDQGCRDKAMPAADDISSGPVELAFPVNYFGTTYDTAYVNNNGNVTFGRPMPVFASLSNEPISAPMIGPFVADVDTRGIVPAHVTYGWTTVGNRPALCVNWDRVGYYESETLAYHDKVNSFQLLLVDRGDVGEGDFDVMMNYDAITWESSRTTGGTLGLGGDAAAAVLSDGDARDSRFVALPGSFVNGALLDSDLVTGLANASRGSLLPGRYVFPVRNGSPPGTATVRGSVTTAVGAPVEGSLVSACRVGGGCVVGSTSADGHYVIGGLAAGTYVVRAVPAAESLRLPAQSGPTVVATGGIADVDLSLTAPLGLPGGTTIDDVGSAASDVPVLLRGMPLVVETVGCPGGRASFTVLQGSQTLRSAAMAETPPGSGRFHGSAAALASQSSNVRFTITNSCKAAVVFDAYVEPVATVRDSNGTPIAGATVTLGRSDSTVGPFETVAPGSAVLSPGNRANPQSTSVDGAFHWDTVPGFYQARASKPGCHVPESTDPTAVSVVFPALPQSGDVGLVLDCPVTFTSATTALLVTGSPQQFTVTTGGTYAALTESGALPSGMTFVDQGNGTALVTGVPTSTGTFPLRFATRQVSQDFTLVVHAKPTVLASGPASTLAGHVATTSFTTTGFPAPTLSTAGILPAGLTFTDDGKGGGTLTGAVDKIGEYPITVVATNDVGSARSVITLVVRAPSAPPAGTTITNVGPSRDGIPVLVRTQDLVITTVACVGGSARFTVVQGVQTLRSGPMPETPPGSGIYRATAAPLLSQSGDAQVTIVAMCPKPVATVAFDIYIDPVGKVVDANGRPVVGATVTLRRSDTATGPFVTVPALSPFLGVGNRTNPQLTSVDGNFNWDMAPGFYQATASKPGCHLPGSNVELALSRVFSTLPSSGDVGLVLNCPVNFTSVASAVFAAGVTQQFRITTGGTYAALTESGPLPPGVGFADLHDGTALLTGVATTAGRYALRFASGGAVQDFVLDVHVAPTMTTSRVENVLVGVPATIHITATGVPAPVLTVNGVLPPGVTFTGDSSGGGSLSGSVSTPGDYQVAIVATNDVGTARSTLTLRVMAGSAAKTQTVPGAASSGTPSPIPTPVNPPVPPPADPSVPPAIPESPTSPPPPTRSAPPAIVAPRLLTRAKVATAYVGQRPQCTARFRGAQTLRYAWTRDGRPLVGKRARVLAVLKRADLGHRLVCTATASNAAGSIRSTSASARIAAAQLVYTGHSTVTGVAAVGRTLRAHGPRWHPWPTRVTYHWTRDGVTIPRAAAATYRVTARDRGHVIGVVVAGSRPGFSTTPTVSARVRVR